MMGPSTPDLSGVDSRLEPGDRVTIPWNTGDIVKAILAILVALSITILLAATVKSRGESYVLAAAALFPVSMLVITLQFSLRKYHCPWSALGFSRVPPRKHILLISSGLIAALSTIALYSLAVNALDLEIPDGMEFLDEGLWLRISGIFLVIIVAPITEEIFFRGFVFGGLNRNTGFVAAAIVSAGIFALLHVHPMVYVPIFLIGLLLAWVYARSGSLWTSIHLHMAYNATIIGVNL